VEPGEWTHTGGGKYLLFKPPQCSSPPRHWAEAHPPDAALADPPSPWLPPNYCSPPSALPLGGRGAQDYKRLDGKVVSVEELEGKDAGVRAVKEAMDLYTAMVVRDLQS
jgi:hypothetical protein